MNFKKRKQKTEEEERTKEDLHDLVRYIKEYSSFLPLAVCTLNPLRSIIDANKAFQGLTGHTSIEVVGKFLEDLFLEKKKLSLFLDQVCKNKTVQSKELTLISKDGKNIPVNLSISLRRDEGGNFIGYFVSLTDITEIKKNRNELETRVEERTKEIRDRMEELEKFHNLTVGRELKMMELKAEIEQLKKKLQGTEDVKESID